MSGWTTRFEPVDYCDGMDRLPCVGITRVTITITTESGVKVSAPMEKWLAALIVTLADTDQERFTRVLGTVCRATNFPTLAVQQLILMLADHPDQFLKLIALTDNSIDAYATIPESVQRSLNSRF